jgi:hypothetical protein
MANFYTNATDYILDNTTFSVVEKCTRTASPCKDGLLFPKWMPSDNLSTGDTVARAFVYGLGLAYMFLGVSIISDRFMSAIEVITSQEKEIVVKDSNGEKQVLTVRIWNETVSNLTVSLNFKKEFVVRVTVFLKIKISPCVYIYMKEKLY